MAPSKARNPAAPRPRLNPVTRKTTAARLLLLAGTTTSMLGGASAVDLNNPVMEIQSGNFESHMKSGHRYFIKFFAPWCTYCKRLKSTWEDLASQVHEQDTLETRIAEVDCTKHPDICTKVGVKGYPTLLYADENGEMYKYSGGMKLDVFKAMVVQQVDAKAVTSGESFTLTKQGASSPQPVWGAAASGRAPSGGESAAATTSSGSQEKPAASTGGAGGGSAIGSRAQIEAAVSAGMANMVNNFVAAEKFVVQQLLPLVGGTEFLDFLRGKSELNDDQYWDFVFYLYAVGLTSIIVGVSLLWYAIPSWWSP